jgi:hypothetical protein
LIGTTMIVACSSTISPMRNISGFAKTILGMNY